MQKQGKPTLMKQQASPNSEHNICNRADGNAAVGLHSCARQGMQGVGGRIGGLSLRAGRCVGSRVGSGRDHDRNEPVRSDKFSMQGAVGSQRWEMRSRASSISWGNNAGGQPSAPGCPAQQMETLMIAVALAVKIRLQRQNGARQDGWRTNLHNRAGCQQQGSTWGRQRQAGSQA